MYAHLKFLFIPVLALLILGCKQEARLVSGSKKIVLEETLSYYLYYPPGYAEEPGREFPLLLFLHGGGESGGSLEMLQENGPPKLLVQGKEFPFLILAPQNPYKKQWWNVHAVMELLEKVVAENRVDRNRLYLTGLSRGGNACWEIAVQYPNSFAAMAVVCGMTPLPYTHWMNKQMPIWVFHGTEDPVIPFSESEDMVKKLLAMGFRVTLTAYEGVGHNAWEQAYLNEDLYQWFLQHSR